MFQLILIMDTIFEENETYQNVLNAIGKRLRLVNLRRQQLIRLLRDKEIK